MGTFSEKHFTPGGGLKIFSTSGRIGRLKFFLSFVATMVGIFILAIINDYIGYTATGKLIQPYFTTWVIIFASAMLAVLTVKRLHDLNRSGWYWFLNFVPFVNIIMLLYLIFKPGTAGANDYGPGTMSSSTGYPMKKFAVGVVAACVVTILAIVFLTSPMLDVGVEIPTSAELGGSFAMNIVTFNPHSKPVKLDNVVIPNAFFKSFEVASVTPTPTEGSPVEGLGTKYWIFALEVTPKTTKTITFEVRPTARGRQMIQFEVCNFTQDCSTVVEAIEIR